MPFSALTASQQILIRLYLMGGPQFRAELIKSGVALDEFAASEDAAGKGAERFTKRTFAQNQALFMARRGLFYASLAAAGLGFEIVKMGFEFNNTMQQASVAFTKFLPSQEAVTKRCTRCISWLLKLRSSSPILY